MLKQRDNQLLSRLDFLLLTFGAFLALLFGQASYALYNFLRPKIEAGAFGSLVVAGQVAEFQPGTVSHIQKGRFYISRLEDGGFLALWQRCTHLGCTVPWIDSTDRFNCPCHSSIFTTTGEIVSGPAPRPLDLFPVEIIDDILIVDTSKPIQRIAFNPDQVTYA
jgi:cytochrome b6-f complex iron-sulfur subunit